jgi:hypothetical protein
VVDADKDFDLVPQPLQTMKAVSLADLKDLFDAEVLEKVFASRILGKSSGA